MNRAQRIHDATRLKTKRSKNTHVQRTEKSVGKALHTPAMCSCPMCGNPRKYFGERTIQERRMFQDLL